MVPSRFTAALTSWAQVILVFVLRQSHSVAQAEVQWHDQYPLQPLLPGSSDFPASVSPGSWNYRRVPPCLAYFCVFTRDGVSSYWPG